MYSIKEFLKRQPSELATGVTVLVNLGVILDVIDISKEGVSALNIAVVTVLGLFYVKNTTVNKAKLVEVEEAVQAKAVSQGTLVSEAILTSPEGSGGEGIEADIEAAKQAGKSRAKARSKTG